MAQKASTEKRVELGKRRASTKMDRLKTVTFGTVSVRVFPATPNEILRNVQMGQTVIGELLKHIQRPGVRLSLRAGVPVYYADPKNPKLLIRRLGGKEQRVRLQRDQFVVCA